MHVRLRMYVHSCTTVTHTHTLMCSHIFTSAHNRAYAHATTYTCVYILTVCPIFTHTCSRSHIHLHSLMHARSCMHTNAHTLMHEHFCAHTLADTVVHPHSWMHIPEWHTPARALANILCTHVRAYANVNTFIHPYACSRTLSYGLMAYVHTHWYICACMT